MIWSTLIAGFVLGAAGSLHCIGMCGPLSLALPTYHLSKGGKFISLLTYQFGRIITYSLFGLLFGLAGRTIFIAGFQRGFSIIAGAVILTAACLYFIQKHTTRFSFFTGFYSSVQKTAAKILRTGKGLSGFLLLGMINGLLPCGMVYIAIASTLSMSHLSQSIGFMAMFGAGTLPAMLSVGYGIRLIKPATRNLFRKSIPWFIACMGLILILRGLNLGILFLSPELPAATGINTVSCHH